MVINNVKLEGGGIFNPFRHGGDAPVPAEPTPTAPIIDRTEYRKNWRGHVARKVRYKPTGDVYDLDEAAKVLGYKVETIRCQCAPSGQGRGVFEWVK